MGDPAYGEIRRGQLGGEIIHPEYHVISEISQVTLAAALTPVYPTTEGVRQATLRRAIDQALKLLDITPVAELLSPELSGGLMSLADALQMLHRQPPEISLDDLALGRQPALPPADSRRAFDPQPQHTGGHGRGAKRPGVAAAHR